MKRSQSDRIFGGVCGGIAKDMGVDPLFIRLGFLGAFVFFGVGPILYLILWALTKSE